MKIVFICGSLEPGRDGVGDYTRRLAGALITLGHKAGIIAFNDPYTENIITGTQTAEGTDLPVLRIPAATGSVQRIQLAGKWVNDFDPQWISIQYVPYAFNPKGLPFNLKSEIKKIAQGKQFHIMFHESWVGAEINSGWKQMLTGLLQKRIAKGLLGSLRPAVIHTHLPVHYASLQEIGGQAKKLPLFSNISPAEPTRKENKTPCYTRIGFFSQVETSGAVLGFLTLLKEKATKNKTAFEILMIGGNPERMREAGNIIEKMEGMAGCVKYTGFLDAKQVSTAMHCCTIGITPVPRHALGKSGSVAAFLAHGIPVAAPHVHYRYDPDEIGFFSAGLRAAIITDISDNALQKAKEAALSAPEEIKLSVITRHFLADLQSPQYVQS